MDVNQTRRINLRRLVSEHEGMTALSKKLGLTKPAYVSQLLADPPARPISEKTARKWEKMLGLPDGWMDGQPRPYKDGAAAPLDARLLETALSMVTEALAAAKVKLPPSHVSEIVVMSYTDALAIGRVDQDRINKIVGLLTKR